MSGRISWRSHVVVAVMVAMLCGLGVWQVFRLAEKRTLIETIETNMALPPVDLAAIVGTPGETALYRRVRVRGVFEPMHFRLMSRVHEGRLGVHIVSPLRSATVGGYVLVDRGWAPADWQPEGDPGQPVEVVGLLRQFPAASVLTADNRPDANEWYWMDGAAMREVAGFPSMAPYYVAALPDETAVQAYPIAQPPRPNIRNTHLQYALTWFSLAVALAVIYILVLRQQRRESPAASARQSDDTRYGR